MVLVPGAPRNLRIENITESTVILKWKPPFVFKRGEIQGYVITAHVLHTYSRSVLNSLEWKVYNDTFHYNMYNLHPGTTYNLSVQASSTNGLGFPAHVTATTIIGTPEPPPTDPKIIKKYSNKVVINIPEAHNDNGPVSAYRIIVISDSEHGGFVPDYLKSWKDAQNDRLPYYITAELKPEVRTDQF